MKIPDEWLNLQIKDIVEFSGGSQPPRSAFVYEPREDYVRLIQIRDYKTDKYATYIPKALAKKFCSTDDVMIGRYGPPIFQILRGLEGAYNVALIKAIPNEEFMGKEYLYYYLQLDSLFHLIDTLSQRTSGQTGIDMEALKSYPFPLPPKPEQNKIVKLIKTWDEAIGLNEQLIAAKQKGKQALIQQLLTGQVRFYEYVISQGKQDTDYGELPTDWQYVPIDSIAVQVGDTNSQNLSLPVLSCTKYEGLVDSLEYFGRQMFSEDLQKYKVVKRHQFAYATNHIEEGSIGYQNLYDAALISPMYTVFQSSENQVHDGFLYRVLKTERYRQIFALNTNGSVNRRGSLRWKEFSKIKVPLPTLPEQQQISNVIDTFDKEIDLLQQKLAALRQQKQGLMQQLLTGKIRVKV